MHNLTVRCSRLLTHLHTRSPLLPSFGTLPSPATRNIRTMASYSCAVSKLQRGTPATPVPEGDLTSHHIKGSKGEFLRFGNPYPSAGELMYPLNVVFKLVTGVITGRMAIPVTKNVNIPLVKPAFLPTRTTTSTLRATWLGHACYHVEFPSGLRVLFDPVFEDRCSAVQWGGGPRRFTPPPCTLAEIKPVDAVLISHSHYDHLSHSSVVEIAKHHPEAHFFVGLGLAKWFRSCGIANVTELDWWEDAELVLKRKGEGEGEVKTEGEEPGTITGRISCLPCQHGSGRTPNDKDKTLWASWGVSSGDKSVWFGGDTGYRKVSHELPDSVDDYGPEYEKLPRCPQFEQIGKLRGPFDLGLIPIGAYKPRWMWSGIHANPRDSVEIFRDTKCKRAMGIHWGTWALTSEEVTEPPKLLKEALKACGIPETGVFDVCAVGESKEF